eukprot:3809487-Pleurochrysis_carterae.AAC.1
MAARRRPRRMAVHAAVSSVPAARAKEVECGSGGAGDRKCRLVTQRSVSDVEPLSSRKSVSSVCVVDRGRIRGRAGARMRSVAC